MQMNDILERMLDTLITLQSILEHEQEELSAVRVNAPFLHRLTENKNEQLSILKHFDNKRLEMDKVLNVSAPYHNIPEFNSAWLKIHDLTRTLSENNYRNGLLLDIHLKNTQEALNFFEQKKRQDIYGPDGHSQTKGSKLGRKFGV